MLAFKYISYHYLKYFFVILSALCIFLVGFDYMENASFIPDSTNLLLIYIVYTAFYAIDLLAPISLVFAMIITKVFLIKSNSLVSFYSLGYSKVDILKPFLFVSISMITLFVSLHTVPSFARAGEHASNIRNNKEYLSPTRDLFFTHKDKFIYFSKMIPLQNIAEGVRVFTLKDNTMQTVLLASRAEYKDNYWYIKEADRITKPSDMSFSSTGMSVAKESDIKILEGFKPKMLDQVYEGKVNFTIQDALSALLLLNSDNIDTTSIKSALYKIIIYPFFVPSLIILIFFFVPLSARFSSVYLFSFGAIVSTLLTWGALFMLTTLSNSKTISAEVGVISPILVLIIVAFIKYKKSYNSRI